MFVLFGVSCMVRWWVVGDGYEEYVEMGRNTRFKKNLPVGI